MEDGIHEAHARCLATWPAVHLPEGRFREHLLAHAGEEVGLPSLLGSPHLADLYLAWAAADGIDGAQAALEAHCRGTVIASALRTGIDRERLGEVEQRVRVTLFVPEGERPPTIAKFGGRGSLRGWVSVIAARQAMRLMGSNKREVAVANDALEDLFGADADPELEHLKSVYREEFATAFRAALGELTPRQRNLLRQRYLDGVEVNQLARLHRTHRSTVFRWVTEARETLAEGTRRYLARQLAISDSECASVLRLIESRMELTMSRFGSE